MNIAIEIQKLSKKYNTRYAVDSISLTVEKGSILGLLGPNGAGKSTVIKMLTTLLPPSSGTAKVNGFDIVKQPSKVRGSIGYVPQIISADGELTAYENLRLSGKLYGLSGKILDSRIKTVLEFMGMGEFISNLVKTYSGGMIRRVEIAQALLHEPDVLFLDEPAAGLDPIAAQALWTCVHEWRREFNTTILITTHNMDEADKLCDKVAFMYQGKIKALDSPANLKKEIGPNASLDDVFIKETGTSIKEGGDYQHAKQIRRTLSHLD